MRKAFENPDGAADEDLKAFIASSSGEDDNDQENTNQPFESLVAPAADSRFRQRLNFSFLQVHKCLSIKLNQGWHQGFYDTFGRQFSSFSTTGAVNFLKVFCDFV